MSVDLDGYNSVQRDSIRRARKDHKCDACRAIIRSGDRYSYTFIVFEGVSSETKRCLRCGAIYEHLCAVNTDRETGVDGELNCGHSYKDGREPPEEISRLAFLTAKEVELGLDSALARVP